MLPALLTFLLVLSIVVGLFYAFVLVPENREQKALLRRLGGTAGVAPPSVTNLERPAEQLSSVKLVNIVLQRASGVSGPLERLVTQSGLKITVGTLLLAAGFGGCVAYLLVKWLTYFTYLALATVPLGVMAPFLVVRYFRAKRLEKFEEQFPESIELIARALRAGHAFPTGLQMVADEVPEPVGAEFKLVYDRQSFGMPMADALKGMSERVPVLDARFFVTAVLTQRETGGNLSEVLDNLASVIRDRFKVKRQVRVISAHGRITGWILAALPPCLAVVTIFLNPDFLGTMLGDPLGVRMLISAALMQVMGTLVIRKLVRIEY